MVDGTEFERDLQLDRSADELTVRSMRGTKWFGAIFAGFGLFFGWGILTAHADPAYPTVGPLGHLLPFVFFVIGVSVMLPCTVTTVFDLRSREIRRTVSKLSGWYARTRVYPFDDVESVGLSEPESGGYRPQIYLKSRARISLNATDRNVDRGSYTAAIESISMQTGLRHETEPVKL
jgi:hypothetical protein